MPNYLYPHANFVFLLAGLLILLLTDAIAHQFFSGHGQTIIGAASLFVFAGGIWSTRRQRKISGAGLILALAFAAVFIFGFFVENDGTRLTRITLLLLYVMLATWTATRQVLFAGKVTKNTIVGSICIYILIGIIWGNFYELLLILDTTSFKGLNTKEWHEASADLVYYSFITLTTIGFGDISPVSPLAKFLTYVEGILGQFYIAILVSSLVGVRLSHHGKAQTTDSKE